MRLVVDSHTHTISSGHSYSTVQELAREASNNGIEMFAVTDHGPAMEGAPTVMHFWNLKVIPPEIYGVRVIKGVEANIIDFEGKLDMPDEYLERQEFVMAGFHDIVLSPGSREENTAALERILSNPLVDAISHPGNPTFPVDIERVVKAAAQNGKLIEINNSSFLVRRGSEDNCLEFARKCKEHSARITSGSDAHISFDVGRLDKVKAVLVKAEVPEELVVSSSSERFEAYLRERKTRIRSMKT